MGSDTKRPSSVPTDRDHSQQVDGQAASNEPNSSRSGQGESKSGGADGSLVRASDILGHASPMQESKNEGKANAATGKLEDSQLAHIGTELRRMYDDLVQEPVPDRLLELLKQLDSPETAESERSSGLGSSNDQETS